MVKSVVFEGGEGCGKTTIVNMLKNTLMKDGVEFVLYREPGATTIGEQIRNVILDVHNTGMTPDCEAMLFAAARSQNIHENVLPALSEGKLVILDRFVESSYVYQGYARGLGIDKVKAVNELVVTWHPDITIFLDIAPEDAIKRIMANPDREVNRLDLESIDFMHRVYNGYMKRLAENPAYKRVDANRTPEEILEDCIKLIYEK